MVGEGKRRGLKRDVNKGWSRSMESGLTFVTSRPFLERERMRLVAAGRSRRIELGASEEKRENGSERKYL